MKRRGPEHELKLFRLLLHASRDGIVVIDQAHRIISANPAFVEMLGYASEDEVIGLYTWEYEARCNRDQVEVEFSDLSIVNRFFESEHRRRDGSTYPVELSLSGVSVDGIRYVIGICRDITQRRQREAELEYLSFHDPLTGVYNRTYFNLTMKRLQNSSSYPISFILIDADDLTEVNNEHGHSAGDEYLRQAAALLSHSVSGADMVARIGGDEFAVILLQTNSEKAEQAARRIEQQAQQDLPVSTGPGLSISLGWATAVDSSQRLEKVLHQADLQMYKDKARKRSPKGRTGDG